MKKLRNVVLAAALLGITAAKTLAMPAFILVYDSVASGQSEIYAVNHQLTSSGGHNPCWTRVRFGVVSGASVAYENAGGIYQVSFTESPYVLSSPVTMIDWPGSNESEPDWIPTGFKSYVAHTSSPWSFTDPGQLVFASNATGTKQIYKMISGTVTQVTFSTGDKSNPTWTQQNDAIVYESGGLLYEIPAVGGVASPVVSGSHPSGDPNNIGVGGVAKSTHTACSIIYEASGIVTTTPISLLSYSGIQPTADFDGDHFAFSYGGAGLGIWWRMGTEPVMKYAPPTVPLDAGNPDLIGLYNERRVD